MAPNEPSPTPALPRTRWQRFRLVVKVVELRLRFIALMALTGLTFAYWDTIWNRYDKWMRPAAVAAKVPSGIEYYCPMHPQVVRDEPGTCPICGMPLTRRKKEEKEALPEGVTARVQLAPFRIRQAAIETTEVAYTPLTETVTTVGFVDYDERRLAHIASKVPGMSRVEKLYVNFSGIDVAEGETLAEIYSPELSQAVQELLLARTALARPSEARTPLGRSILGDPQDLVRMAEQKLKLWGMTQAQLNEIERAGRADFTLKVIAPVSGHVLKKNVVQGQYVSEGQAMFEIADLTTVWVKAEIFEDQIGLVRVGEAVEAVIGAFPGRVFPGKVGFLQPHLETATRTMEIWYALDNPGHQLRPGMYATVTVKAPLAESPMFRGRFAQTPAKTGSTRRASLTADEQRICPVTGADLGSMGEPVAVQVLGRTVWTCCDACPPKLKAAPSKYLAKLEPPPGAGATESTPESQKVCPVTNAKLGSMGAPIPVEVQGRKVWTCCDACPPKVKAAPAKYLARLQAPPRDAVLTVPESAVIDTGPRKIVYVETEPGVYEGRLVVLGPRSGNRFPVLEGLAPGEKVATAGAFLIDAESRLNPATRGDAEPKKPPVTAQAPHQHGG